MHNGSQGSIINTNRPRIKLTSYLQRLGVHPSHRGSGIGTQLVSDSIEWAAGRRSAAMLVNTQDSNATALRLYQHLGFTLDREKLRVLTWPR